MNILWSARVRLIESRSPRVGQNWSLARPGGWVVAGSWLAILYFSNAWLPQLNQPNLEIYVLKPALWLALAVLALRLWRRDTGAVKLDRWLILAGLLIGALQVMAAVLLGLLAGFGSSPYAKSLPLVLLNLWYVLASLIGVEIARWYLVATLGKRNLLLGAGVAWLLAMLTTVPLAGISGAIDGGGLFRFIGRIFLPAVSENLLATYLVLLGGPLASIAYRAVPAIFEWSSPALPNLEWITEAFIGTLIPILGLLIARQLTTSPHIDMPERLTRRHTSSEMQWVVAGILLVCLIWFNSGFFGVHPSLLSGVSMEPTFVAGDVVIVRKVAPSTIKVDDVVEFRQGNSEIIHRVNEIRKDANGKLIFITQGDNNNVLDSPWDETQLRGKAIGYIPKVGWVGILVKNLVNAARAK